MIAIGFDTSNYTTSAAWYDGKDARNFGRLLDVKSGEIGLRQSEALFQHIKNLPEIAEELMRSCRGEDIAAVGASTCPRTVSGSYMPCFLAGHSQSQVLASALGVPFYGFSHQQGHLAAALWSAGRLDLMDAPVLAWHLSGGTTELLYVKPGLRAEKIGGSEDLSAGQLIDRTGRLLGLPFPSGKALEELAGETKAVPYPIKLHELSFSLSGMQNKAQTMSKSGRAETAAFILECVADVVRRTTEAALRLYGAMPVLVTGGVASNMRVRKQMESLNAVFGSVQCSTDNAVGIAVLAAYAEKQHG